MDADEDDFVFYGTPIEREEEMTSRKKKAVADAAGQMRSLPQWKQEVTDEEGRRRFHGAFTGGFSAGYYNTAGSKEGWTPQSFTSSRKSRAEVKEQNAYNFMDDDEKAELEGRGFGTSSLFDTFGFTAADVARKQAEKELIKRPSAIPGPLPDELILPAANSIGVKLLLKMGWRHGHLIKDAQANSLYEARREARKAFLAFSSNEARPGHDQVPSKSDYEKASEEPFADEKMFLQSTPVFVLNPKQDLHGLGYDPFKHAPEFRERKRLRKSGDKGSGNRNASLLKDKLFASNSGKVAPGFGIGALEELDVEDEDIYASGFEFEETYVEEVEEPPRMARDNKLQLTNKEHGELSGFKVASNSDFRMERFTPPVIPPNFEPHHKFIAPLEIGSRFAKPPPLEVPPPDDTNLKLLIEGFATLVSRCGKLFEDLSREKNKNNPLFSFLTGGNGHDFYTRKLWEEQQKRSDQQQKQQVDNGKAMPSMVQKKLTAESRGRILGEKPLESTKVSSSSAATNEVHLQFGLSDTFTKPSSLIELAEATRPFKDDPRKQERFEQFLKDKYRGGLRSANSGGASNMSEADRARERVDFERAAEKIEKGEWSKPSQQIMEMQPPTTGQFISGGIELYKPPNEEKIKGIKYPRREEYQWRPSSILCKRFDIADPFMGKPPPIPRPRSRMDSLIFTSDSVKPTTYEPASENRDSLLVSQTELQQGGEEILNKESEIIEVTPNVERPVDLYKAIFSDDSDEDDGVAPTVNRDDDADKPPEVGNTTLNRLIAGDFLESLGKELGLEVPPDPIYYSTQKTNTSQEEKQTTYPKTTSNSTRRISSYDREINALTKDDKLSRSDIQLGFSEGINTEKAPQSPIDEAPKRSYSEEKSGKVRKEEMAGQNRSRSEKRRHRSRSSMSSSDSSDSDRRHRDRSRYKDDRRDSSRQKSKKHSKHHKHKNKGSPSRSSRHGSDSEDDKRGRRKSRQDRENSRDKRKSKHHSSSNLRKGYHHE